MTESAFQAALAAHRIQSPAPAALGPLFDSWPDSDHPDLCAQCAHTLQHTGASEAEWRPWLMLATWGWALSGQHWQARALACALGIDAELHPFWPTLTNLPKQPANRALAHLLGLFPLATPPAAETLAPDEELDAETAWEILPLVVDAHDWALVARALACLAEASREFGGATESWDAGTAPGYEPLPTGACALALRAGFQPEMLSAADRKCFWPAFSSDSGERPVVWLVEG
jgi:hypothetical protein